MKEKCPLCGSKNLCVTYGDMTTENIFSCYDCGFTRPESLWYDEFSYLVHPNNYTFNNNRNKFLKEYEAVFTRGEEMNKQVLQEKVEEFTNTYGMPMDEDGCYEGYVVSPVECDDYEINMMVKDGAYAYPLEYAEKYYITHKNMVKPKNMSIVEYLKKISQNIYKIKFKKDDISHVEYNGNRYDCLSVSKFKIVEKMEPKHNIEFGMMSCKISGKYVEYEIKLSNKLNEMFYNIKLKAKLEDDISDLIQNYLNNEQQECSIIKSHTNIALNI